jgi:hypothetical protein
MQWPERLEQDFPCKRDGCFSWQTSSLRVAPRCPILSEHLIEIVFVAVLEPGSVLPPSLFSHFPSHALMCIQKYLTVILPAKNIGLSLASHIEIDCTAVSTRSPFFLLHILTSNHLLCLWDGFFPSSSIGFATPILWFNNLPCNFPTVPSAILHHPPS